MFGVWCLGVVLVSCLGDLGCCLGVVCCLGVYRLVTWVLWVVIWLFMLRLWVRLHVFCLLTLGFVILLFVVLFCCGLLLSGVVRIVWVFGPIIWVLFAIGCCGLLLGLVFCWFVLLLLSGYYLLLFIVCLFVSGVLLCRRLICGFLFVVDAGFVGLFSVVSGVGILGFPR